MEGPTIRNFEPASKNLPAPATFLTSRSHKRKIASLGVGELEAEQGPLRRHIRCEVNDIGVVAGAEETVERVVRRACTFDAKKLRWR